MATGEHYPLLPFCIIAFAVVLVMCIAAFKREGPASFSVTLCGYGVSFISSFAVIAKIAPVGKMITPLLIVDGYSLFFIDLILAASFVLTVMSHDYLRMHAARSAEYHILLLTATLGAMVLAASGHFLPFFLGLEILSLALYALIAYLYTAPRHLEAGIKYLILSSVSMAFLLFGMALIYDRLGTMEFQLMSARMSRFTADSTVIPGTVMILVGVGFKLALVPFHMWAPDVYEGAPVPIAAFIATVSKGAVLTVLVRFIPPAAISEGTYLFMILTIVAVATMFTGNFLALLQRNVKRLLAYSSIAQFGYLLVAFLSAGTSRLTSIAYYLVAYFVMTIGAFGIVTVMADRNNDGDSLDAYAGLFYVRPGLAAAFAFMLLALAGMPLTMGLIGKLYIFVAGIASGLWFLAIVLAISSVIGLFYYMRVISIMFVRPEDPAIVPVTARRSGCVGFLVAALAVILVALGVYPAPLIVIIQRMIGQ
ncbi:MAG: NADH-quinone oxidoreductase subunit N [Syntrophorhabdus sp.]